MKLWLGIALIVSLGLGALTWKVTRKPVRASDSIKVHSVALALASGGLGDRGVNDSAYQGLQSIGAGIRTRICEYRGLQDQALALMQLAQGSYDLIIAVGEENAEPLRATARRFPETRFALVDAALEEPNVSSVVYSDWEGDFVAGALSALLAGGRSVALLTGGGPRGRTAEQAFRQGVLYVRPQALILAAILEPNSPTHVARSTLDRLYGQDVHVLYAADERLVPEALLAAESHRALLVASGSYQDSTDVLVSYVRKNVGVAVRLVVEDLRAGSLGPGVRVLNFSSSGFDLASLPSVHATEELIKTMERIQGDLTRGHVQLLDKTDTSGR